MPPSSQPAKKKAKEPPTATPEPAPAPQPEKVSTEELLRVLRSIMGDKDAVLVYNLRLVSKHGDLSEIQGHCSFNGILAAKRMSTASSEVEDQLTILVLKPLAAEVQAYADAGLIEAARLQEQDDGVDLGGMLPDVRDAPDMPEIPAGELPPPQELSEPAN